MSLVLLAEQATTEATGWITAAVTGSLTVPILYWIFYVHLPSLAKERDKRDEQVKTMFEFVSQRHENVVKEVTRGCQEDSKAALDAAERRHAEQMRSQSEQLAWQQKIHESVREGVHATRNLSQSIMIRQRLADAVQSSEAPIWTKALDGTLMSWNAACERLLGWKQGEVVGKSIYQRIIPPDRKKEEEAILQRIAAGEAPDEYETERVSKDGSRVHISVVTSPIRDQSGRVVGASSIAREV